MKYPLLPRQSIEYSVLHALEVGYTSASDIETYLRDSGRVVYPRHIRGALQRLRRDGMAAHKNKHERDRWKLVKDSNLILVPNAIELTGALSARPVE